jgi:hypothetical protein
MRTSKKTVLVKPKHRMRGLAYGFLPRSSMALHELHVTPILAEYPEP